MAALPTGGVGLDAGVEYQQFPALTWSINKDSNQIDGYTDGLQAVQQAAEVILNVERFRWQIYQSYSGICLADLIGQAPDFVEAELKRRVREALGVDDRIQGVSNFSVSIAGESMTVSFRVDSVYGKTNPVEVTLT